MMSILYSKWHALRCDILQETACFFRTVCKSVYAGMCDEALFVQCLPGSWTAVPEVKLAVVSLGLKDTHLLRPHNTTSAKWLQTSPCFLLRLPVSFSLLSLRNVLINSLHEKPFSPTAVCGSSLTKNEHLSCSHSLVITWHSLRNSSRLYWRTI